MFTLVGTMSYEKGMFAFFDGNNSDLRKVLYQSDSNGIAGYTVAEITPGAVKLQSADKKQTVEMKIGDTMRQEGSEWLLAGQGELPAEHGGKRRSGGGRLQPRRRRRAQFRRGTKRYFEKTHATREQELK